MHGPAPVAGFTVVSVEAVGNSAGTLAGYESRLSGLRVDGGDTFNFASRDFSASQLQVLLQLQEAFQDKPVGVRALFPNTLYCFHGTRVEHVSSVCRNGLVALRGTDQGYFGLGCYSTLSIEYAARYARGDMDAADGVPRATRADGCVPVVMLAASVGMAYPVTRSHDYTRTPEGHSDWFGRPLRQGFDAHVACVSQGRRFECVDRGEAQYVELVVDQAMQLLPVAVIWMRSAF